MRGKIRTYGLLVLIYTWSALSFGQQYFEAVPLDINTGNKEIAPAFYENGIVFSSDRRNDWLARFTNYNGNQLTNLYYAEIQTSGKSNNPQLLSKELSSRLNEGSATFSADGSTVYFTRNLMQGNWRQADTALGIFSATLVNGNWTNIRAFIHNRPDRNTVYPSLSSDGNTLYFCSDAEDGLGGYDIYVSRMVNGNWSTPINLGDRINTAQNEVFPYIHESGRLYFASRGHHQANDLDIFFTEYIDGSWMDPVPLPEPFNTDSDDYGLILNASLDTGYFVTNRMSSADIFRVTSTLPVFTACPEQEENSYCYVFYESNNAEMDTTTYAYEWDLGDGTRVRSLKADHCYQGPGTYYVELNVIDKLTGEAYFSQASYELVVEDIEQPYITAPDSVVVGEEFILNATNSYLKDFEASGYFWDFGDSQRAASMETTHSYLQPGIFEIQLGVTADALENEAPQKRCVTRKIVVLEE